MTEETLNTSIRLPVALLERINEIALRDRTTRSDVIRETLEMAIDARSQIGPAKLPRLVLPK